MGKWRDWKCGSTNTRIREHTFLISSFSLLFSQVIHQNLPSSTKKKTLFFPPFLSFIFFFLWGHVWFLTSSIFPACSFQDRLCRSSDFLNIVFCSCFTGRISHLACFCFYPLFFSKRAAGKLNYPTPPTL